MAWRAIQDTVGRSVSLSTVSADAERLYWRMLAHSNPYGRVQGHPLKLRALCFPMLTLTDAEAGTALIELVHVGRIIAYEVDGEACIAIVDFDANQPKEAYKRRGESKIPAPPELVGSVRESSAAVLERLWGVTPEHSGSKHESPANDRDSRTRRNLSGGDEKETETRREEKVPSSSSTVAREAALQALDDDDLESALGHLRPNAAQRRRIDRARTDEPDRLKACLREALTRATRPEPYLVEALTNGSWPEPIPDPDTLQAGQTIDIALAWQRFISGYSWDDAFTPNMILEELTRLRASNRVSGYLADSDALAAWQAEHARRYDPEPTVSTADASRAREPSPEPAA